MNDVKKDFAWAVAEAAQEAEFVNSYNNLTGNNFKLNPPKSVFDQMVDNATGYKGFDESEARKFAAFVYEFVWSRLPSDCFESTENGDRR
jgi:hypothetical protein